MKIKVHVIPNSKAPKVIDEKTRLVVYVDAPPIKGKANKRLIEILAKHFGTKKSKIIIISGEKNREKVVEISQ